MLEKLGSIEEDKGRIVTIEEDNKHLQNAITRKFLANRNTN